MNRRAAAILVLSLALTVYAVSELFGTGFLMEELTDPKTPAMILEWCVLWALLTAVSVFTPEDKRTLRLSLTVFISCAFLWIHRSLVPVFVTGVYILCLMLTGELLLVPVRRREGIAAAGGITRALQDFLSGSAVYMVFLCVLSLFKVGAIGKLRFYTALLFLIVGALFFLMYFRRTLPVPYVFGEPGQAAGGKRPRVLVPSVLSLLLLQAGRMNEAIDYDSMHYALRSLYILNNGQGIYENLGSVNDVYFYPKGTELLTMPLEGTATYGFVIAFSVWAGVLLVLAAREIAARGGGRRAGDAAALFTAAVPGIMNMAVSAKSDMVTLLMQAVMLNELLLLSECMGKKRFVSCPQVHAAFLLGAYFLSLTMKPTSLVFSTVLLFTAAVHLAFLRVSAGKRESAAGRKGAEASAGKDAETFAGKDAGASAGKGAEASAGKDAETSAGNAGGTVREKGRGSASAALVILVPCFLALFFVTLRTLLLTGYPYASVFTSVWEMLGFHGKYPLAVNPIPSAGAGLTAAELLRNLAMRAEALFLGPDGDENRHIVIAWGTVLVPVLLTAFAFSGRREKARTEETPEEESAVRAARLRYYAFALTVFLLLDLATLTMLWQVDGNYYMLTYLLGILAACEAWSGREGSLVASSAPALVFAVFMTFLTNWAGSRGFTEIRFDHRGYFDHEHRVYELMLLSARDPVYDYLVNNPRFRVMAFAEAPDCYRFPCSVESYTDVEGSGGNALLVKKLNWFKDYLENAHVDFIYAEDEFLEGRRRASDIIRYMQEDGSITPFIVSGGGTLYEYHAGIRD